VRRAEGTAGAIKGDDESRSDKRAIDIRLLSHGARAKERKLEDARTKFVGRYN
jgi:hypothetical protein